MITIIPAGRVSEYVPLNIHNNCYSENPRISRKLLSKQLYSNKKTRLYQRYAGFFKATGCLLCKILQFRIVPKRTDEYLAKFAIGWKKRPNQMVRIINAAVTVLAPKPVSTTPSSGLSESLRYMFSGISM